jgi:hypothetical protein
MKKFSKSLIFVLLAGAMSHPQYGSVTTSAAGIEAAQQGGRGNGRGGQLPELFQTRRESRCAVQDPTGAEILAIDDATKSTTDKGGVVTIPVYWHIVTKTDGTGDVSALVPAQMQVLNDAYAGSRFAFATQSVRVIANDTWYAAALGSAEEAAMKTALRRGGPDALNIYTTNGDVYLGWATPAFYYKFFPSYDGVVLWWAAMPGTGLSGTANEEPDGVLTYDQGDTGTHEVGHWLGLAHTFAGGCTHPGDSIKDTPTEAEPQFFCVQRDSCVGQPFPGTDPITNFMDYVDDVCMDNFTSDQTKRMRKHWHAFRAKKARD